MLYLLAFARFRTVSL